MHEQRNKLRRARRKRFLTIEEAADLLGVSVSAFGRWERGVQVPHLQTLGKLCKLFESTSEELGFDEPRD
jgi:DNA-binding XRE family transcriptional regulator